MEDFKKTFSKYDANKDIDLSNISSPLRLDNIEERYHYL